MFSKKHCLHRTLGGVILTVSILVGKTEPDQFYHVKNNPPCTYRVQLGKHYLPDWPHGPPAKWEKNVFAKNSSAISLRTQNYITDTHTHVLILKVSKLTKIQFHSKRARIYYCLETVIFSRIFLTYILLFSKTYSRRARIDVHNYYHTQCTLHIGFDCKKKYVKMYVINWKFPLREKQCKKLNTCTTEKFWYTFLNKTHC